MDIGILVQDIVGAGFGGDEVGEFVFVLDDPEQRDEFRGVGDDDIDVKARVFVEIGEDPGGEFQNGGDGFMGRSGFRLEEGDGFEQGWVMDGLGYCSELPKMMVSMIWMPDWARWVWIRDQGNGNFEIAGVANAEKIENDFLSTLRGEKFNIQLSSKGHLLEFDGKKILVFKIDSMPRNCKPIYYGGDIRNTFMRQGSGDYRCSPEEIQRMLREASEFSSDAMVLEGFTVEDVDEDSVKAYRRFLAIRAPESPFLGLNDGELLLKLGCLNKERDSVMTT